MRWIFGFQRRRVRRFEWETLFPKLGPLPQISHTDATFLLLGLFQCEFVLSSGARLAVGLVVAPIDRIFRSISGSFRRPLGRMKHGEFD